MSKPNFPGSSTLTDDGKACEVKLDFPLFCGLTADSVPGWPRCYDDDAKLAQWGRSAVAASSRTTATKKEKLGHILKW